MMEKVVAAFVVAALIFMGWLAFVQKHPEACLRGRLVKTLRPCGSLDPSMAAGPLVPGRTVEAYASLIWPAT